MDVKRFRFCLPLALIACLFLMGCSKKVPEPSSVRIAMIIQAESNPFFVEMEKGVREYALAHNVKLVVVAENKYQGSDERSLCMRLLDTGLDALIMVPESGPRASTYSVPLILHANRRKVPVVTVHAGIDDSLLKSSGARVETLVTIDKERGALLAGEFVAKKLEGRGRILIMEGGGYPSQSEKGRRDGFLAALKNYPDIKVFFTPPGKWRRDDAFSSAVEAFKKYPRIDAVYAYSEPMVNGILDAIDFAKVRKPIIVGFDGTDSGKRMIEKGKIEALIDQKPYEMGKIAIESALKIINGEKIDSTVLIETGLITIESVTRPFTK